MTTFYGALRLILSDLQAALFETFKRRQLGKVE
jgi:hypothetical protein